MSAPPRHVEGSSRCIEPACDCSVFASNLYRPALCVSCYHSIAEHFPGLWFLVNDETSGKVFYEHTLTKTRLYARPYDPSAASAVLRPLGPEDGDLGTTAGKLTRESFLPFNTGQESTSGERKLATRLKTLGHETASQLASPPPGTSSVGGTILLPADGPTAVPQSVLDNLSIDLSLLTEEHGHLAVASSPPIYAPSAPLQPLPPKSALIRTEAEDFKCDGNTQMVSAPPSDVPASGSSSEVHESSEPELLDPASSAGRQERTAQDAAKHENGEVSIDGSSARPAVEVQDNTALIAPIQSDSSTNDGASAARVAAVMAPPPSPLPSSLRSPPPLTHVSTFLQPLFEDPLLVRLDAAAFQPTGHEGMLAVNMQQPFNEFVPVARVLVLTPFTVMALAPHPTQLGVGILCWERSLLSLTHLATQPLYSSSSITPSDDDAYPDNAQVGTAEEETSGDIDGNQRRRTWSSWLSGSRRRSTRPKSQGSVRTSPSSSGVPLGAGLSADVRQVGVGVLASFAPETEDTVAFLRVWRAGRRPVPRQGFLLKRKKGGWREHARLGPLAWKRRVFSLQQREILYYARVAADGTPVELKGTVPLNGWVEVSRAGPDVGASSKTFASDATSKVGCFLVRTGKTFHVFQAASAAEATSWIDAIAITAQHVGVAQHDPQCIILPTEEDALRVSSVIQQARQRLLAAMSSAARTRLGEASADLTLDVVTNFRHDPASQSASDALYAASIAAAEAEEAGMGSDDEGGEGSADLVAAAGVPPGGAGLPYADALAMAHAMGGVPQELLQLVTPEVARAVLATFQGGMAGDGAPPAVASTSGDDAAPVAAPASFPVGFWVFVDHRTERPSQPVSALQMRDLLRAGLINAGTLARSCEPVPGLGLDQGVNERGLPLYFLPLGVLFSTPLDPESAFGPPPSWSAAYVHAALFESLVSSATQLGVDRGLAVHYALFMKDGGMAPDLSLLLDICGWTGSAQQAGDQLRPVQTPTTPGDGARVVTPSMPP